MNDVSKCKFESGIVPYMYGEMAVREATEFESHLLACSTCTDEFAAVSAARYEVYEWKKLEFDPLATPVMEIPQMEPVGVGSWVEKLRMAFAGSWAVPGVAFAGLALAVAFTSFLILSRSERGDVARNNTNSPSGNTVALETKPAPATLAKQQPEADKNDTPSQPRPVRVSEPKPNQARRVERAIDRAPKAIPVHMNATKNPKAPTLNNFDDEEDTSLRLAELFENIDTRD